MMRSPILQYFTGYSLLVTIFIGFFFPVLGQQPPNVNDPIALTNIVYDLSASANERQNAALQLAESFENNFPDSTLKYADLGLSFNKDNPGNSTNAQLHIFKSIGYSGLKQMQIAKTELLKAERIAADLEDDELKIKVSHAYSNLFHKQGQFDQSIQYALEMLRLAEAKQDTLSMAMASLSLSASMLSADRSEEARKYSLQAIDYGETIHSNKVLTFAYNNLAVYFTNKEDLEKAIGYYEKGLEIAKTSSDSITWALPLSNLASALIRMKRYKEAEKHINLAMEITEKFPNHRYRSFALMTRGELEYWTKSFSTCAAYLQSAYEASKKTKDIGLVEHVLTQMVALADSAHNYGRAFLWQKELQGLRDSLFSNERLDRMKELEIQYETQKTESENALLLLEQTKSEARTQNYLWIGLVLGLLLIALVVFLFGTNRIKSRHNRILRRKTDLIKSQNETLKEKNEQLNAFNEEKDALMGVVAHDLKAPLSKAEGLLSIISMDEKTLETNEQYIKMMEKVFKDGKNLIEELVLVNDLESKGAPLKLETVDLRSIASETSETFEKVAAQKEIHLLVESKLSSPSIQSHPGYIKRTLDNLISNSIKFSPKGKNILVLLKEEGQQLRIEVKDEGPGIPENEIPLLFNKFSKLSNRPTAGESSTGLGLSIVKGLVNRLNGEIFIESTLGEGSKFTVLIPLS